MEIKTNIMLTTKQIAKLKNAYESNKHNLNDLSVYLDENGILDNGVSEIEETFEMGYNNAFEYVFQILGIAETSEDSVADKIIKEFDYDVDTTESRFKELADLIDSARANGDIDAVSQYEDEYIRLEEYVEAKIEKLQEEIKYEEERLEVCGCGKSDFCYLDELESELEKFHDLL